MGGTTTCGDLINLWDLVFFNIGDKYSDILEEVGF